MSICLKCHPHFCPFNSPACPEKCKCVCKRIKPNCVSVTAQQALNIAELHSKRSRTGTSLECLSTRERVFGIPYDPRKDLDIPVPDRDVNEYLKYNFDNMESEILKDYVKGTCCLSTCTCSRGSECRCHFMKDKKN